VFPDLTEGRRRELCKQIKKTGEDAKIAARNNRRDAMDALKKLKNDKVLSEDETALCEKEVEKQVADAVERIDSLSAAKEKEIMTV
ncbi:MAG: ribosome recycling factor, partial [Clostridia bacterium]|nr:ribosome recycling factor [Clostridia bacterium]